MALRRNLAPEQKSGVISVDSFSESALLDGFYPNIDFEAGGSIREWGSTLDRILELDFDHVIPGHGAVTDREGIVRFQRFIQELWQVGEAAAQTGKSLEDTLGTTELRSDAGFGVIATLSSDACGKR